MAVTSTAAPPAAPSRTREVLVARRRRRAARRVRGLRVPRAAAAGPPRRRPDDQAHAAAAPRWRRAATARRDAEQVAAVVSERFGRGVSARERPPARRAAAAPARRARAGGRDDAGAAQAPRRCSRCATAAPILPARAVNVLAVAFAWLHVRRDQVAAARRARWSSTPGCSASTASPAALRTVLYEPAWLLALLVSIVVATAFHEIGHASACRYGGARPGEMGVGALPGLARLLLRRHRGLPARPPRPPAHRPRRRLLQRAVRAGCGAAYFATGAEALLFAAFVQHLIVLQQLLPLLRFDGYYVLSDLTGVPDILVADQADLPLARARPPARAAASPSSSRGCASW